MLPGAPLENYHGHTGGINSVTFSPDGQVLTSGSVDKTIRLWNTTSGELLRILTGHTSWIQSVDSVQMDKRSLVEVKTGPFGCGTVSRGKHLKTFTTRRGYGVNSVYFSPDGYTLASGHGDETIRLWDLTSREHLKMFMDHTVSVYGVGIGTSVAFSLDSKTLASGGGDGTIFIWHVAIQDYNVILSKEKFDYYEYLKSDRWQHLRRSVLRRDNELCICGAKATEVHHKTYERIGNEPLSDLVSLCRHCHQNVHDNYKIN